MNEDFNVEDFVTNEQYWVIPKGSAIIQCGRLYTVLKDTEVVGMVAPGTQEQSGWHILNEGMDEYFKKNWD